MIKHIVFWKIKDSHNGQTKAEIAQQIKEMLNNLKGVIPGMIELEVGIGGADLEATYDVCLYTVFADKAALDGYAIHPEHEKVKAYIGSVKTARECMDYAG